MKISVDKLIEGYYETIKSQYPDLTLEELHKIVKSPFMHFKKAIKQLNLPTVKWKYFGSFVVYEKRLEARNPFISVMRGTFSENKFFKIVDQMEYRNRTKEANESTD